ncbi:hypothetical protein Cpir12675_002340 [Ceratocystis pirilliformis]|uniref:TM7S3/TM198-like domain-containing protein n=1 Tax=Ceratocystis pirilliformis TaxID=259994 RepID=A0ABR3ZDB2_9PEZI
MLPRSVSILISLLSVLLLSHDVAAHLLRRQQVDLVDPISTHSVIQTTSTSKLNFSETPTVTASDFSFLPTTTPHATITSAPFNLTNSTVGRNSTATHNSTATSTATTAPYPALPIKVRLTPAFAIAGALLIISGGVLAFWNNKSIQAFIGGAMLAALATIVLIVYVMNPPISKGLQCAYLVAGLVTGLALGGMSLLFREIIESLTCLLCGFCIGMWFLCLGDDGLIHVTAGRVALIAGCSFVAWSIYWIPFTRDWTLMALTSFAGATVVILGVDCYSRAGLKELWVYLWDIHADLFEYNMTFNITKGIRAELAAIIVLWGAGIVAQAHLWRKIYSRKNAKRAEKKAARADVEALNEAAGRAMQTQLAHEKANWERTYADSNSIHEVDGDDKSKSRRSSEDSGVHGIAAVDYSQSGRYSNHRHGGFSASEYGAAKNGIPQRHISTITNAPRNSNPYPGSQPLSTPRRSSTKRVSSYSSTHTKSVPISPVASQPQISPGRSSFHTSVNSPTKSHHEILIEEPEYLAQDGASQEFGSNRDESLSLVATVDDAQSRRSLATNHGSSSSNKTESHQHSQNDANHIESLVSGHNSCKSTSNREDEKECASSQTSTVSSVEKVALPGKISQAALKSRTNDWVRQSIGADHPDLENIKTNGDSDVCVSEEAARPVNVQDLQLAAGDVSIPTTGVSQTLADFYGPSIAVVNAHHEKHRTSRKSAGQESNKQRSSGRRASAGNSQTLLDRRDGYLRTKHQLAQVPQSALSLRASDSRIISRRQSARNAMDESTGQLQRQNLTMSNLIIPSNNQNPNSHRRPVLSPKRRESQLASFRESMQADPGVRSSLSPTNMGPTSSPTLSPGLKPSSSLAHMGSHLCYRPEDEQILERQRSLLLDKMEADRTTRENELRNRELADQRLEQMMNFGGMQSTHREMLRRMQDKAH